jgi:phosphomevalonate kinase
VARVARAPGKVVVSGAYSVLEGAPALVAAVDRYVVADADRPADRVTDEVRAALEAGELRAAPWFDASALRAPAPTALDPAATRKLGLGSSAAILCASLAASLDDLPDDDDGLAREVLRRALDLHRRAQHGGSGVDVAACALGGVVMARLQGPPVDVALSRGGELDVSPHEFPATTEVVVFSARAEAATSSMLTGVRDHAARDPRGWAELIGRARAGAEAAASATTTAALVAALREQSAALAALGAAAHVPIVTEDVAAIDAAARREGAVFLASGAGGGDVALWVGPARPSNALVALAADRGLDLLAARVGARGVHRAPCG